MKLLPSLTNPWRVSFELLLQSVKSDLVLCSPFISQSGSDFVARFLPPHFRRRGKITIVTNLGIDNILSLSIDPAAVQSLTHLAIQAHAYHLPGLHAKVYIADTSRAIVTSGNLTSGGLRRNNEYGIEITDRQLVESVRSDVEAVSQLGTPVPDSNLAKYCRLLLLNVEGIARRNEVLTEKMDDGIRDALKEIEADLLRLRLADGPIHSVFARTIFYLLQRNGPLPTARLHELIQSIHPDLCDMTVDRIIGGRSFGKKWKHAVRTAQQQLKQQRRINYEKGLWQLASS